MPAYRRRKFQLLLALTATSATVSTMAPAGATESVWNTVGYLPNPTTSSLTKCATEKPWPVNLGASLDKNAHVMYEHISITKPNTPCATYYYIHEVSITDEALNSTYTAHSSSAASQSVPYPVSRASTIEFEVVTGDGQGGPLSCQYWYFLGNGQTQPVEYGSSRGAAADC